MADIKDLFNRNSYSRVLADATLNKVGRGVESPNYVRSNVKNKLRFIPQVDFSTASNFAIYGSAESYFENSINECKKQNKAKIHVFKQLNIPKSSYYDWRKNDCKTKQNHSHPDPNRIVW